MSPPLMCPACFTEWSIQQIGAEWYCCCCGKTIVPVPLTPPRDVSGNPIFGDP